MIAQFVSGLSIIVGLHELGHLLFAKLFGMRVESYIIGFPPKLFSFKWGETEYALGVIPFGGAVKISGMVDESLDTESLGAPPQPWEFRSKPAWQRLLVMLGGIIFNIITGIAIYITLAFVTGDTYLAKDEVNKCGIVPNVIGYEMGFQEGDKITHINGRNFKRFAEILSPSTLLSADGYYTVLRGDQVLRIDIPPNLVETLSDKKYLGAFVAPRVPFKVAAILPDSSAAKAGLQPGDQIIALAGMTTTYLHQLQQLLAVNIAKEVTLSILRQGRVREVPVHVSATGKLGFRPALLLSYEHQRYCLRDAIAIGTARAFNVVKTNAVGLSRILTGKMSASKSLSGPIGIAKIFGYQFIWIKFWSIVGFLSMVLALTNLLPIPALDGGHVMFLLYEMTTGHRLSDKFLEAAQKVGMSILLFLIGYTIFNDLYKSLC